MHRKERKDLQEKQDAYGLFLLDEAQNEKEKTERESFINSITSLKGLPGYEDYAFIIDEISMNPVINNLDLNILKQQLGLVAILLPGQDSGFYKNRIRPTQKFKNKVAASLTRFLSLRADAKDDRHTFANMKYIYRREQGKEISERDMQSWLAATNDLESKVAFLLRLMHSDVGEHTAKIVAQRVLSSLEDRWDVLNDIQRELIISLKENIDDFNNIFDPDMSDPSWRQREGQLKGKEVPEDKKVADKSRSKSKAVIREEIPADILLDKGKQLEAEITGLRKAYQDVVKEIAKQDEIITHKVNKINEFKSQENAWIQLANDISEQAFTNTNYVPEWAQGMPEMPPLSRDTMKEIEQHENYKEAVIILPKLVGETMKKDSYERVYSVEELEKYKDENEKMLLFLQGKINEAKEELKLRNQKNIELEGKVIEEQEKLNRVIVEFKAKTEVGRDLLVKQRQYILNNSHNEILRIGENIGQEKAVSILSEARSRFSDVKKDLNKIILDMYGSSKAQQFLSAVNKAAAGDSQQLDQLKRKRFFEFRSTHLKRVASLDLLLEVATVDKSMAAQPHDFHKGMNVIFSGLKAMSSRLENAVLRNDTQFAGMKVATQEGYKSLKSNYASDFSQANEDAENKFKAITEERDEHLNKIDRQLRSLDARERKLSLSIEHALSPVIPSFENHVHQGPEHPDVAHVASSLFTHPLAHSVGPHPEGPKQADEEGFRDK